MGIPIVVGLMLFTLGIGMLSGGIVSLLKRRKQNAGSLSATGVVTAFARGMGRSGYIYYPQVQFAISSGQAFRFQSSAGSSRAEYGVGQEVKVLYCADNPQQAEIDSASSLWLLPGIMIGMGIVFVVVGSLISLLMILVAINRP